MKRAIGAAGWFSVVVGTGCAPSLDLDYGGGGEEGRTECQPPRAPDDAGGAAGSALVGRRLEVAGVATLALSLEPGRSGFFLQTVAGEANGLGAGGLFIAWPGSAPATGTRVRVRGTLGETAGIPELQAVERLDECGWAPLAAEAIDARELERPEAHVGRWVRARGDWRVIDVPASPADGRVTASPAGRVFASGHPLANAATAPLWTLRSSAPAAGRTTDGAAPPRLGAALDELEGVLSLRGQARELFTAGAPAWPLEVPAPPPRPSGSGLRIVGLNLDNYFVSLGARGARDAGELARQRDALVALFVALDADILALTELENRAADSLIHLLDGLDRALPADRRYAFEEAPAPGGSALRAGIAYRPSRVHARAAAWFDATRGSGRPPLFQTFSGDGLSFTLGVVHFTSKRCEDEPLLVPPDGCGDDARRREAELLLDTAAALNARAPLDPLLLMGDFNADTGEAPLERLAARGYRDLLSALPAADRYSYVFEGRASLLDHALAADGFAALVRSAGIWHINADEPRRSRASGAASTPTPRGASDHDPIVIDLHPGDLRPMGL